MAMNLGAPQKAVRQAQAPANEADLLPTTPARERLAYDEILASQLAVALVRARRHRQKGRAILGTGALTGRVEAALGFALTSANVTLLPTAARPGRRTCRAG